MSPPFLLLNCCLHLEYYRQPDEPRKLYRADTFTLLLIRIFMFVWHNKKVAHLYVLLLFRHFTSLILCLFSFYRIATLWFIIEYYLLSIFKGIIYLLKNETIHFDYMSRSHISLTSYLSFKLAVFFIWLNKYKIYSMLIT